MITNYKIDQLFTSNFSVEEGEKNFQSHLKTWSRQNCQPCWNVFYAEARTVSGRKTIQSQHCESQFIPSWTDFFLVPFKESRFPLFRISIQAGKRSSRSITTTNARWNPVIFSSKQRQAGWSTSSQARERRKISPPSSAPDFTHSVFHGCKFWD